MSTLTAEAKQLLSTTIRSLRQMLLQRIRDEAERQYQLSIGLRQAKLSEFSYKRRARLEAWLEERIRASQAKSKGGGERSAAQKKKDEDALRERLLSQAIQEAAATFLNRIVCLRHLEALVCRSHRS